MCAEGLCRVPLGCSGAVPVPVTLNEGRHCEEGKERCAPTLSSLSGAAELPPHLLQFYPPSRPPALPQTQCHPAGKGFSAWSAGCL